MNDMQYKQRYENYKSNNFEMSCEVFSNGHVCTLQTYYTKGCNATQIIHDLHKH